MGGVTKSTEGVNSCTEDVAKRYGVDSRVVFNKEVATADFVDGRWYLETTDGDQDTCDFVIAATGVLHHPNIPEFEGADSFRGRSFIVLPGITRFRLRGSDLVSWARDRRPSRSVAASPTRSII